MQVHAIYENGRLTFEHPIRLKNQRIELDVNIPDNYILDDERVEQTATTPKSNCIQYSMRSQSETGRRLDAIVGPLRGKFGSMSPQEVKDIWHQHLEEKYLGKK